MYDSKHMSRKKLPNWENSSENWLLLKLWEVFMISVTGGLRRHSG